jgi:hypothetical protein
MSTIPVMNGVVLCHFQGVIFSSKALQALRF